MEGTLMSLEDFLVDNQLAQALIPLQRFGLSEAKDVLLLTDEDVERMQQQQEAPLKQLVAKKLKLCLENWRMQAQDCAIPAPDACVSAAEVKSGVQGDPAAAAAAAGTARSLRPVAEQHGEIWPGATDAELQSLVASLRAEAPAAGGDEGPSSLLVPQPAVPPAMAALWREGLVWHFSQDHMNVYGFNIFKPSEVVGYTPRIFGDWECRADWRRSSGGGGPCVADPGWLCLASLSEYDYMFCCFDSASPSFGHVRHMVNNRGEDHHAADSMLVVAERLLAWQRSGAEEEDLRGFVLGRLA